eukprot:353770-Pelagomonas_calceolata.AAC.3
MSKPAQRKILTLSGQVGEESQSMLKNCEPALPPVQSLKYEPTDTMPHTRTCHDIMHACMHHSSLQLLHCMRPAGQLPGVSHASCQALPIQSPGLDKQAMHQRQTTLESKGYGDEVCTATAECQALLLYSLWQNENLRTHQRAEITQERIEIGQPGHPQALESAVAPAGEC